VGPRLLLKCARELFVGEIRVAVVMAAAGGIKVKPALGGMIEYKPIYSAIVS